MTAVLSRSAISGLGVFPCDGDGRAVSFGSLRSLAPASSSSSSLLRRSLGELGWAGLGRAGLGWAGQGRAGLSRTGLGRADLSWAGLGKAGLGWAGLGWAGQGWAGLGRAGLGRAGLGWAGLGRVRPSQPANVCCGCCEPSGGSSTTYPLPGVLAAALGCRLVASSPSAPRDGGGGGGHADARTTRRHGDS
ncbi:unnamed protein product [Lampetra fluviatilis]